MDPLAIHNVSFSDTHFSVTLAGGATFTGDLSQGRYADLARASAAQRADSCLRDEGATVAWPHLGRAGFTIAACDLVWETLCDQALAELKALDWKLEQLPRRSQEIVALWRLEADGYNGGFMQFFCNWGEANCALALLALQHIDAHATHGIVARQRALLDRLEDHPELQSLNDLWKLLTPEELSEISERLDSEFWDAAEELPALAARHYFA